MSESISNGPNGTGRDDRGRFRRGYKGGPGNPHVRRLAQYRQAIASAVTPGQLARVIRKLARRAEAGEVVAIRELLDRLIGRPQVTSSYVAGGGLDFSQLRTADDVAKASEQLATAVSSGEISPDDAARVGLVLSLSQKCIEMGELAREVRELRELMTNHDP